MYPVVPSAMANSPPKVVVARGFVLGLQPGFACFALGVLDHSAESPIHLLWLTAGPQSLKGPTEGALSEGPR